MKITTLFLDIGGVLLTNGWDRKIRKEIITHFSLEEDEFLDRHNLIFDTYEIGKLTFEEYLENVIFYRARNFSLENIKDFAFNAAHSFAEMIAYVKELKEKHGWKIGAVTNEGQGLIENRINKFALKDFIDFFVISSHVGLRKPDKDIYRLALAIAQSQPQEVLYIEDRNLLVEQAKSLGIEAICHINATQTKKEIEEKFFERTSL